MHLNLMNAFYSDSFHFALKLFKFKIYLNGFFPLLSLQDAREQKNFTRTADKAERKFLIS